MKHRYSRVQTAIFSVLGDPKLFSAVGCFELENIKDSFGNADDLAEFHLWFMLLLALQCCFWWSHTVKEAKSVTFLMFKVGKFKDSLGNLASNVADLAVFHLRFCRFWPSHAVFGQ